MTFSEYLRKWLRARPYLSVNALEVAAGLPRTTLGQMMIDRDLPEKHYFAVVRVLCNVGFEVGGWQLSAYPDHPGAVFYRKWLRRVEDIETKAGSFEYIEAWAKGFDDANDLPETLRAMCENL